MNHHPKLLYVDTVRAFHFGVNFLVEVDIVLPEDMTLKEAHDIGEPLQQKLESLPEVERAFVHLDYEFEHRPSDEHKQVWIFRLIGIKGQHRFCVWPPGFRYLKNLKVGPQVTDKLQKGQGWKKIQYLLCCMKMLCQLKCWMKFFLCPVYSWIFFKSTHVLCNNTVMYLLIMYRCFCYNQMISSSIQYCLWFFDIHCMILFLILTWYYWLERLFYTFRFISYCIITTMYQYTWSYS